MKRQKFVLWKVQHVQAKRSENHRIEFKPVIENPHKVKQKQELVCRTPAFPVSANSFYILADSNSVILPISPRVIIKKCMDMASPSTNFCQSLFLDLCHIYYHRTYQ